MCNVCGSDDAQFAFQPEVHDGWRDMPALDNPQPQRRVIPVCERCRQRIGQGFMVEWEHEGKYYASVYDTVVDITDIVRDR